MKLGGAKARSSAQAAAREPSGKSVSVEPEPGLRVWLRLLQVRKLVIDELRDELSGEVTLPRFDLLASLHREDGQTLASLSRRMLVTAGNVTGLVDRAERDGLLARRRDPGDRRAIRVHLSPRGKKLYADAIRRHARRVARVFAPLDARELDHVAGLLDRVRLGRPEKSASRPGPNRS